MPFFLAALPGLWRPVADTLPARPPEPSKVDLNRADWAELMLLPGVGELRARDIVRFRERCGPFERVEDLARVPGFGARSVERLRPFACVTGGDGRRPAPRE